MRQISLQAPENDGQPLPHSLPDEPGRKPRADTRQGNEVLSGFAEEEVALSEVRWHDLMPQRPVLFLRLGSAPEEKKEILMGRLENRQISAEDLRFSPALIPP